MSHVIKHNALTDFQWLAKTVITDYIARQTSHTAQPISMSKLVRHTCAQNIRAVWHFQYIGHMASSGGIENRLRHGIPGNIQNLGNQHTAAQCNSFTRFKINLQLMASTERLNQFN